MKEFDINNMNIIKNKYPNLNFNLYIYQGLDKFINITIKKTKESIIEFDVAYLIYLNQNLIHF